MEMSLVERNDLNLVVKSYTVHLVGQAIVHITTEPCIDHQAGDIHSATTNCLPEVVKVTLWFSYLRFEWSVKHNGCEWSQFV